MKSLKKMNDQKFKLDCKYFKGYKPCKYSQICKDCQHYSPVQKRILIIKLESIGDVLRTTPILRKLKQEYSNFHITWLTSYRSKNILLNNKFIDRLLIYNQEDISRLEVEKFDVLISLDKAYKAVALASLVQADRKLGYGLSQNGKVFPFNKGAEYAFKLGLCDELKFKNNEKSYQQLIFEIANFEFKGEEYVLSLGEEVERLKRKIKKRYNLRTEDFVIGLNIGCGDVFPHKKWTVEGFLKLIQKLLPSENNKVVILAGPNEKKRYEKIINRVKLPIIGSGYDNSLKKFISLMDCCDLVVSGDTLAMHLSVVLKKKVVALFGPTASQEIELYGRGMKIVSSKECAPCYKHSCELKNNCMENINVLQVYIAILKMKP